MSRPSPISKNAIKGRKMVQIGKLQGEKCTIRFGLSKIDTDKKWRQISVYPPTEAITAMKEFDLENDGLNNILKQDSDDREYVNLKVRAKKTKCKGVESLEDIERDDSCVVVVVPTPWKMDGNEGVCLKTKVIVVVDDAHDDIEIQ